VAAEGKARPDGPEQEDKPELLVKLEQRKARHRERNRFQRAGVVALGILIVLAGVVLSGPGVPGPGILVILIGLSFLALEFDWAERLLERAIVWADNAAERAQSAPRWQKLLTSAIAAVAIGAFIVAAILWDIPLLPVA
jgi:uncharacterized protein (TIGR02611 family)